MIKSTNMKRLVSSVCVFAVALGIFSLWPEGRAANSQHRADHVRWDIISANPLPPGDGTHLRANGVASAFAYSTPGNPSSAKSMLTGAGTFVAPASGGGSSAVAGGGTWETSGAGLLEARGTYRVTKLVDWQFANFQAAVPAFIDEIADGNTRANGNAVLLIEYDDGTEGMLGVGCHGPGAPNGILEGVIASKGFLTYWNGALPSATVDANRTVFHVLQ